MKPLTLSSMQNVDTIYTRAQAMLDEGEDDVKGMNKMILFMKTHKVRDQQLLENQQMEREYIDNQRKLDLTMEIERLKDLQVQAERKRVRKEAAIKGGQVIVDQIVEKDHERQRQKEALEREKEQMRRTVEAA